MTPYYDEDGITIYHGDCIGVLANIVQRVGAIVTDPPYCSGGSLEAQRGQANGQGLRRETLERTGWFEGDNMSTHGLWWLLRSVLARCRGVVAPGASALVFSDWRMMPMLSGLLESSGVRYRNLIVWDKGNPGLGRGFRAQHELIMEFAYGTPQYHRADIGNVISSRRERWEHHPTQKPVGLLAKLISTVADDGEVVLDPFMGSGTTLVAAKRLGHKAIGIEISEKYCEIAAQRLGQRELFGVQDGEALG